MHIDADGDFHLTYCTNIHPGEDWPQVMANLERYVPPLKARLAPERPFGIGLRLSDTAARQLLVGDALPRFADWLAARDLYVFTINGFPHGGFHGKAVKDRVYAPDWRRPERLDYTMRLIEILAALVPDELDGGISTVPLSYKPWIRSAVERESALERSSRHLAVVAALLARMREETGRILHLDLEPEPDCLLENTADVLDFYRRWLLQRGAALLAEKLRVGRATAEERLLEHLRLCYDTCHFAVEYEEPGSALSQFQAEGIRIGKVQVSAALRVRLPDSQTDRQALARRLHDFAESTYLHQTVERRADGELRRHPDLTEALPRIANPAAREWRIHFHVPIFIDTYGELQSTQPDIVAALRAVRETRSCRQLEIETYTWDVLPPSMKENVLDSIQREYVWVLETFGTAVRGAATIESAATVGAGR